MENQRRLAFMRRCDFDNDDNSNDDDFDGNDRIDGDDFNNDDDIDDNNKITMKVEVSRR